MHQRHLDRLTAVDASFLAQESPSTHMHIGALVRCAGPAPALEELVDHVRARLHLVPRYRQRLAIPPLEASRPLWADDPAFDVCDHITRTVLPAPGGEARLTRLTAQIMGEPLDRTRPLWALWLVEGLAGGGFALLSKSHHALADGMGGVDLAAVLFDVEREPPPVPHAGDPWRPHRTPTRTELLAGSAVGLARSALEVATGAAAAVARPQSALRTAGHATQGLGEIGRALLDPAPPSPLNVPIGPDRRYAVARCSLADVQRIRAALGGTVNDVVLAVVTAALRDWLHGRDVDTEELTLRALVPVSTRRAHQRGQFGNRVALLRGPLPVGIADPRARLEAVSAAMDALKASKQAVGAELLAGVGDFAPPAILAQAARLTFSARLFNLLVTNVPGPPVALHLLGREITGAFPIAFLPRDHALAVAALTYRGELSFGLLADRDAMPDLQRIADGIAAGIAELVRLS